MYKVLMVLVWLGWSVGSVQAAAVSTLTEGVHDFRGQVVRCGQGQRVGLTIVGADVQVQNLTLADCDEGIQDRGQGTVIRGVRLQNVTTGFVLGGVGGWVEENTCIGVGLCYVLTGHQYTLVNNRAWDNSHGGYLITGHNNLVEGNEALRNGRAGFYVAWSAPGVLDTQTLLWLKQKGVGNVLRGNTALNNGIDLAEVPPQFEGDCDENLWEANTFGTSQLPAPCPPEEDPFRQRLQ